MATAQSSILARLQSDPLLSSLLIGGIWNRPIKRENRGATPGAFDTDLFLRPSLAVEPASEIPLSVSRGGSTAGAYYDQVTLHFYSPSDDNRLSMSNQAYERCVVLLKKAQPDNLADLTPWWYVNDYGRRMFPTEHSALGFYPSETFLGGSEKLATFRFVGTRPFW